MSATICRMFQDYYAGKKDEQSRKSLDQSLEKYEKIIAGRSGGQADRLRGVAICLWAGVQLEALDLDMPVDLTAVIKRLEQASAEAPCSRLRGQLVTALLERAALQVSQEQKALAEMLRRGRRAYFIGDTLGLAAEKDPAIRDALNRHPDIKRALEIRKTVRQAFPKGCAEWEWSFLRTSDPTEAQAIARAMREDETSRLTNEIYLHVYPYHITVAMDEYWFLQAEGKADQARALLTGLAQQKMPLPFDP